MGILLVSLLEMGKGGGEPEGRTLLSGTRWGAVSPWGREEGIKEVIPAMGRAFLFQEGKDPVRAPQEFL